MKEFKLRVYNDIDEKEPYLADIAEIQFDDDATYIKPVGKNSWTPNGTILLFAGRDKNNHDIFQNDIIIDKNNKEYVITWSDNYSGFLAKTDETQGNCYDVQGLLRHGAVYTGNIYGLKV